MSLALAHATGSPDFEKATTALNSGLKYIPDDAAGAVLTIGVYLLFVDALSSMQEDANGFSYEFKPTPLRNAADWLLSGKLSAALAAFQKLNESGRQVVAAMGLSATYFAMGDNKSALPFARMLLSTGSIKDFGVRSAVGNIQEVALP